MADDHPFITMWVGLIAIFLVQLDHKPFAAGMIAGPLLIWFTRKLPPKPEEKSTEEINIIR